MTAEERARELLFKTKTCDLPKLARAYLDYLSGNVGACGEVYLTAYAHYAQAVEKLSCTDEMYEIDEDGRRWFETRKSEAQ